MPTPKYPFCYAIKNGDNVTLYALVYLPAGQSASFSIGRSRGQTMLFSIAIVGTPNAGNTLVKEAHVYPAFSVTNPTIDTIEVKTLEDDNPIKTTTLMIADLDVVVADRLGLPTLNNLDIALDTPYVCLRKIDTNNFKTEVVVITNSAVAYIDAHTGPPAEDKNTLSKIDVGGQGIPTTEITVDHTFLVADFGTLTDNDAHTAMFTIGNPPKIRQNKTKNKAIKTMPFPKPRPK